MSTPRTRRRHRHRAKHKDEQGGFVLLVVMFVLLMAGTSSLIAVDSSRAVLRAAGHHRTAAQVRYMAESVVQMGIVLADNVDNPLTGIPNLHDFGQPPLPDVAYTDKAYQFTPAQFEMARWVAYEAPIWTDPDLLMDPVGTMGPDNAWSPANAQASGHQHYAVHFTDCVSGRAAAPAGTMMAGGNVNQSDLVTTQYCVGTGRARSAAPGGDTRTWQIAGFTADYVEQVLSIDRAAMATVVLTKEGGR